MNSNNELYDFFLDNIQKIFVPEDLVRIELSMSRFELQALMLVGRSQNVTMGNLAQGMSAPVSTATGIIDRLVKKGLLTRGRNEEDRRIVIVTITDNGKALLKELKDHFHVFLDRIRNLLSEEEFETGLQLVRKVILGFQKEGQEPKGELAQLRRSIMIE